MFVPNSFRHQKCGDKKPPRFFEKFFDRTLLEKDTEKYASDPIKYPEYDRYKNMVESSEFKEYAFGDTFDIGMVVGADLNEENNVVLALRRFVRPEDTSMSDAEVLKSNRHELYLSGEEYLIIDPYATERLVNRCYVTADRRLSGDRTELKKWLEGGHLRFYCFQTVNESSGDVGGPLNRKDADVLTNSAAKAPSYPRLKNRLRKFDMFSGAGGMSQGLHAAGLTEASYAVEFIKSHAEVYKRNFPSATVFHTDVNVMFERMQRGEKCDASGQRYPQRGDVDLICGGPPCQGFSGMNSAKHEKASTTKRSLVASFLATIDNLRPRLVLMENVSGMAMTVKTGLKDAEKPLEDERAEVLSVVSEALRAIGYQVTVRKLQAALHGVPQDRRRILIMAAAPGEKLPDWPEPTTTCPVNVMKGTADHHTHLKINGKLYRGDRPQLRDYPTSAPYRGATVHEAISDITTDALVVQVTKPTDPSTSPRNHVIPKSHWLQQARVDNVPKATELPYADWRLLPNVKYEMKNGQCTDILKYTHAGIVFSNRAKLVPGRGVCACQHIQKQCTREERSLQKNTLIPAALPHTGSRYQQWAGLFGRPYPHGVFQTIVTVPNPFNKQGQVLHPEQNRLLSVRELARGQGFPDTFKFDSDTTPISVNAQYEQVGNAVPPPLALAIGREIVAALTATAADIAEL
uniref:DNA (cytosine-5-)-methyltransferase n=1 Tax=Plectus sambesii TaxID=2011161 RepID=A0A914X0L1_9BILA